MRIVITVNAFFPRSSGGTEVYTLSLAQHLKALGHDVVVVTCESHVSSDSPEVTASEDVWQGISVQRLYFNVLRAPNPVSYAYHNPCVEAYLREFYRDFGANLVYVCHPGNVSTAAITAARELRLPVVTAAMDFWYICPVSQLLRHDRELCSGPDNPAHCLVCYIHQRRTARRYRWLVDRLPIWLLEWGMQKCLSPWMAHSWHARMVQALLRRKDWMLRVLEEVDCIVSPSRFLRGRLVENGVPPDKIVVSAHGIDADWARSISQVRCPSDHVRFTFIGMIGWHKGAHIAVQAFNRLERPCGATLTLYGDNQHFARYFRQLSRQMDRNPLITYGGRFPHSQIAEVLSGVDVLVMPSMWYENTPMVMYEAFATKIPVIATREGGMVELIDEFEGGWTFPRGDVDALAALMQRLIDCPQHVSEASERIKPVRTLDEHLADLMMIYEQACGGRGGQT